MKGTEAKKYFKAKKRRPNQGHGKSAFNCAVSRSKSAQRVATVGHQISDKRIKQKSEADLFQWDR